MSWDAIFITALGCGIGAIAGILLGWLLSPITGRTGDGARRTIGGVLVIAGAVAGYALLPGRLTPLVQPLLDGLGGEQVAAAPAVDTAPDVREEIPQSQIDAAIESAMTGLNDPFLEAVLEREPNRAEQLRTRLASAYRRGGEDALLTALMAADQDILQVSLPFYMARAQSDDLLAAVRQIRIVIETLAENDPMTCHSWLYGAMSGEPFDFSAYLAAVGQDRHLELQTRLAAVVRGADDILPEYDEFLAMAVLDEVRQMLNNRLGDEKVGLITAAQLPENEQDARLACEASAAYYDFILAEDEAVAVFRHRYSGGNEYQ